MYKSKSQPRLLDKSPGYRENDSEKQIKQKIFGTKLYQRASPAEKARLEQDHGLRLPKIKSTLYSNPKFVGKSRMIIANKLKDLNQLQEGYQIERSRSQMLSFKESQEDVEKLGMPRIRASHVEIFNNSYANTRDLFTEAETPEQQWTQEKQITVPTIDELVKLELRPNKQE